MLNENDMSKSNGFRMKKSKLLDLISPVIVKIFMKFFFSRRINLSSGILLPYLKNHISNNFKLVVNVSTFIDL